MQTSQRRFQERTDSHSSCQLTSILARSAARISKHSSRCAMSRSASARKSFAGCQSGATEKWNVCSARARVWSLRDRGSTPLITEAIRTKKLPKRNLPPLRLVEKSQPPRKNRQKLLLLRRPRHRKKDQQKNPAGNFAVILGKPEAHYGRR